VGISIKEFIMALGPDGTGEVKGYYIGPGADLRGARLAAADLRKANLAGADLTGADLSKADLRHVDFTGANLTGTDLEKAKIGSVKFIDASMEGVKLDDTVIFTSKLIRANLKGARLSKTRFLSSDLTRVNLEGAILEFVIIYRCKLKKANLKSVIAKHLNVGHSDFIGADVRGAEFTYPSFFQTALIKLNFQESVLIRPKFLKSGMQSVNLKGLDLKRAVFRFSGLELANLSGANLEEADFTRADLTDTNFTGAIFKKTDFTDTTNIETANITGTNTKSSFMPVPPDVARSYGAMTGPILKMSKPDSPEKAAAFKRIYPAEFEKLKADTGGRDFTQSLRETIKNKYLTPFTWIVTQSRYKEATQRLSKNPNTLLLFNLNPGDRDYPQMGPISMDQACLLDLLFLDGSPHPQASYPLLTLGWVRYTVDKRHKVILIEEIQSDINSSTIKKKLSDAEAGGIRLSPRQKTLYEREKITLEEIKACLALISPYLDRFYEDAIGLIFQKAEALGYTVEMLGYEDKAQFCYEDDFGKLKCPPKGHYTDLPKRMGMAQKRESEVPTHEPLQARVSYYKPNPGVPPADEPSRIQNPGYGTRRGPRGYRY
jgi:uncharacterized protein YjbI with pentapeptide repeats